MGFSVSGGTAIILIAAVASAGMLYTTAYNGYESVQDASEIESASDLQRANTEVEIVNVTHDTSVSPDAITVTVRNDGTNTLSVTDTDLLLNGTYQINTTRTVSTDDGTLTAGTDGTDLWQPREELTISVREDHSEPITVKVVTGPGVTATEGYP
ncbi:fla cluster protein FlaF [Halodesulfurarchaeum sp. HSR-GB]|uniref:fla cluster protein FlaF n=1 Tax=Halodesulfurarchaeum sp. HSR-GB TaxID=3074077 RepID=UPI0028659F9A|nr:fla cluster protein FlaF [Halodesulfurarchaeum sp. HSR-GB]MDR5656872.1 fla cluster protein FlaF [Halodesulfurarchaeum sp. HSR-GB]